MEGAPASDPGETTGGGIRAFQSTPLLIEAVAVSSDPSNNEGRMESKTVTRSRAPTVRRTALLNTLVFLGLALSHADFQAQQAETAPSNGLCYGESRGQQDTTVSQFMDGTEMFPPTRPQIDPTNTREQLQTLFDENEASRNVEQEDHQEDEEYAKQSSGTHEKDIFIVAAVDGTMAAIDSSNGNVIWRQAGEGSKEHYRHHSEVENHDGMKISNAKELEGRQEKILQPLIATTTTVKSSRQSATSDSFKTVAIPSIDGSVYLTTATHPKESIARPTGSAMTTTITSSLRELVSRAPYVDNNGRFYVGSRHATAVAIDGDTGDFLYMASADGDDEISNNSDPQWEGRNVVWLGRVDYSVSVYNARTSTKEVQFSAAEIMSVNDMIAGQGRSSAKSARNFEDMSSSTSERAPNLMLSHEEQVFDHSASGDTSSTRLFSELVSTPSGNVAYRNPDTGQLEWVADQIFETPVAYAVRSSTGRSLGIDIIPDVTMPSESKEYLAKEIERQIDRTLNDSGARSSHSYHGYNGDEPLQPPMVGSLLNGQLYAIPLGKRKALLTQASSSTSVVDVGGAEHHHRALGAAAVHQHHSAALSSSTAPSKHPIFKKTPTTPNRVPDLDDERQIPGSHNKICSLSSHRFPGCLFKAVSHSGEKGHGLEGIPGTSTEVRQFQKRHNLDTAAAVGEYLPDFAYAYPYASQQHVYHQNQHRQRNYRKILRILGSWLPPTIALIFVVSFELGRRKRQNDAQEGLKQITADNIIEYDDLLRNADDNGTSATDSSLQRQVIKLTDQVLGYGGHGTVVFRGMLEGRNVAVKRMLKTYLASADREISLLIESDGHPNVVRYFLKEIKGDFVYLALELCDLSLHSLIGTLVNVHKDSGQDFLTRHCLSPATKKLIFQIATGVRHLHSLRIVHNDLKPANILLALAKECKAPMEDAATSETIYRTFQDGRYVAKISDMGLGKMLAGQSSFGGSTLADVSIRGQSSLGNVQSNVGIGPGTVGWMAPEAMRIKSNVTLSTDLSAMGNSAGTSPMDKTGANISRASRSVDIFSLGCIFYSTLVPGSHPFGEWYEREANIMHNQPCIEPLKQLTAEGYDLVSAMIQHNPRDRPTAKQICEHPFFWSLQQKLSFVCDLSDRLETDATITGAEVSQGTHSFAANPLAIERNATQVVGLAWDKVLYKDLVSNVQRYRAYDPCSVRDLLRLIRNKHHHYDELPGDVRQRIGTNTEGLMQYFESCFPQLLLHCYKICREILADNDPLIEKYSITTVHRHTLEQNDGLPPSLMKQSGKDYDSQSLPLVVEEPKETVADKSDSLAAPHPGKPDDSRHTLSPVDSSCKALDDSPSVEIDMMYKVIEGKKADAGEQCSLDCFNEGVDEPPTQNSVHLPSVNKHIENDIVLWEGSTAARACNCRGWTRSDEDWTRRIVNSKKRNANLVRCAEDPKFRTRLCNHWDISLGSFCPMRRKNKCVFAHGPVELRVKEGKRNRWGKLVDKNGNNSNPNHSGGEDTYGAARSIESVRKEEGKWNKEKAGSTIRPKKQGNSKKKAEVAGPTSAEDKAEISDATQLI